MAYIITSIVSFIAGGVVAWIYRGRIASKLAQLNTATTTEAAKISSDIQTSVDASLKKL